MTGKGIGVAADRVMAGDKWRLVLYMKDGTVIPPLGGGFWGIPESPIPDGISPHDDDIRVTNPIPGTPTGKSRMGRGMCRETTMRF